MKDIDKKDVADVSGGFTEYPISPGWPGPGINDPYPQDPISPIVDDPWITDPDPYYQRAQ